MASKVVDEESVAVVLGEDSTTTSSKAKRQKLILVEVFDNTQRSVQRMSINCHHLFMVHERNK